MNVKLLLLHMQCSLGCMMTRSVCAGRLPRSWRGRSRHVARNPRIILLNLFLNWSISKTDFFPHSPYFFSITHGTPICMWFSSFIKCLNYTRSALKRPLNSVRLTQREMPRKTSPYSDGPRVQNIYVYILFLKNYI